jgi:hypothetical protein
MKTRARLASIAGLAGVLTLAACASGADSALDAKTAAGQADAAQTQAKAAYPVLVPASTGAAESTTPPGGAPVEPANGASTASSTGPAPAPRPSRPAAGPRVTSTVPAEPARDPRTYAPSTPSQPDAPPARPVAMIAAGTTLSATIDDEITTEHAHEGDHFRAELAEDVLGPHGEVLLHAGSIVNGRVAASHESTGPQDPASLKLEVESITADGRTLGLAADVVDVQIDAQTRDSNQTSAAKVAGGAAAGALIGRILGGSGTDAPKGAAVGAAAGAAAAYATRSGHAVVKPGAVMKVRLTDRLVVEQP